MSKTENQAIRIDVDTGGIATVTIDLPGRSMNVITPAFTTELVAAVERIATDATIKAAVVTSGKAAFIAGADLMDIVNIYGSGASGPELMREISRYAAALRKLETCGKPVAAAINGTALGGGLELCLACHFRVLSDDPKAVVGLPEVQVGLLPGAGGTQRLPRLIGIQPALELMTQGTHVEPAKAKALGIVHALAPAADVVNVARKWLREAADPVQPWDKKGFRWPGGAGALHPGAQQTFMAGSALIADKTQHNYPAPIAILSAVYEGSLVPFDTGLRIEARYFTTLLMNPVYRNMTRTLFINKGAADKLVRRPAGVPKSQVTRLGMLGAGMMGAGIAYVSARAGIDVVLLDTTREAADKGKDYSLALLQKRVDQGRTTAEEMEAILGRIHTTADYADLKGCELVIEAVFESREIKADVTRKTEAVIPATAVFASNTSTLPISGLAEASQRPASFIGLHFFSPVDKMPLVEVILGSKTSDECLAKALDYVARIRKTPIVVNDSRGFYTSRVFMTYCNEGMALLQEGVLPALIENAGKQAGMPVGPLAVHDEVSLELSAKIHKQTQVDLGDKYTGPSAIAVALKFAEQLDRKGKKYGKGFYEYPQAGQKDGKKFLWPGIAGVYPPAAVQPHVEEVKKRLLYIQALESFRCFDEGVVTEPADADIGSILGWGYPPWTGGTLSFIETVGLPQFVAECDRLAAAHGPRFRVPDSLRARSARNELFYPRAVAAASRSAA
ncbi:MAG: 3-hydroxyacyl-CoA dehydrogenase NAD-binding domain-containing protein [Gammaproteobacteria bacterium]